MCPCGDESIIEIRYEHVNVCGYQLLSVSGKLILSCLAPAKAFAFLLSCLEYTSIDLLKMHAF